MRASYRAQLAYRSAALDAFLRADQRFAAFRVRSPHEPVPLAPFISSIRHIWGPFAIPIGLGGWLAYQRGRLPLPGIVARFRARPENYLRPLLVPETGFTTYLDLTLQVHIGGDPGAYTLFWGSQYEGAAHRRWQRLPDSRTPSEGSSPVRDAEYVARLLAMILDDQVGLARISSSYDGRQGIGNRLIEIPTMRFLDNDQTFDDYLREHSASWYAVNHASLYSWSGKQDRILFRSAGI